MSLDNRGAIVYVLTVSACEYAQTYTIISH